MNRAPEYSWRAVEDVPQTEQQLVVRCLFRASAGMQFTPTGEGERMVAAQMWELFLYTQR